MRMRPFLIMGLAALVTPSLAQAHLLATGLGPLYDGAVHFGISPEDILPVAVLGCFTGLRGPALARLLLAVLPLAWLAGGALALAGLGLPALVAAIATSALFLGLGGLLAANLCIPRGVAVAISVGLGLLRGIVDMSGGAFGWAAVATLAGMAAAVFVVFALAASVTLPLTRLWTIVALRVGGSWVAATGLLMAGWIWRYGAHAI